MNNRRWSDFLSRGLTVPAWLLILIAIGAILAALARVTIPDFVWVLVAILLLLIGWLSSQREDGPGSQKELYDGDPQGRRLTVSNHPAYANPTLLPIPSRDTLKDLRKAGKLELITSVAGDLVFEVNRFATPANVTIHYTEEDERLASGRQQSLIKRGLLADGQQVRLIPVHLDSEPDGPIWKAFENFEIYPERREITVHIDAWGDKSMGVGTEP